MDRSLRALLEERSVSQTEIPVISLDVARGLNYLHQKHPIPILTVISALQMSCCGDMVLNGELNCQITALPISRNRS